AGVAGARNRLTEPTAMHRPALRTRHERIERPPLPWRKPTGIDTSRDLAALVAHRQDLFQGTLDLDRPAVVKIEVARIVDIGGVEDLLQRRRRARLRRFAVVL